MNRYNIRKKLLSAYFLFILVSVGFAGLLVFDGVVDEGSVGVAAAKTIIVDKDGIVRIVENMFSRTFKNYLYKI